MSRDQTKRRVLPIAIVVVVTAAVFFAFLRKKDEPGDKLTEPVERLLAEGNFARAKDERDSVRERLDPGWNDYLDGVFLLMTGDYKDAADDLARAHAAHPTEWKITAAAASATMNAGRFADARAMVEGYVAAVPDDERGLASAAEYRLDERNGAPDAAGALQLLDRVAVLPKRVAPPGDRTAVSDATLHRLRAKALAMLGRFVDATQEARAAVRLDPRDAEAWYLLGDACRLAKPPRSDDSLDAYERAFGLAPRNRRYGEQFVMATFALVVPGTERGRFDRALSAVESMLRLAPNDAALLVLKARLFARNDATLDAANDLYAQLLKRDLSKELRLQALRNRAVILFDWKVGGQRSEYLREAYELLKEYVALGGVVDASLRDTWEKLQAQFSGKR